MASVKCVLLLVSLFVLGAESQGEVNLCPYALRDCYSHYRETLHNFNRNTEYVGQNIPDDESTSGISSYYSCRLLQDLRACISRQIRQGICSPGEENDNPDIQTAYRLNSSCSGTTLPKASLIGILIAAVLGLLFRA